ncbi:MAG TPA: hypothetical protein VGI11_15215 [Variovorax sp.]
MEYLSLVMLIVLGTQLLKSNDQRQRIALLGSHLGKYQIEKLMENLTEGYLRWLGEADAERREQIWRLLNTTEEKLSAQFDSFAAGFARVDAAEARVSRIPVAIPYAPRLVPGASFDLRQAFALHARGIGAAMRNEARQSAKAKAFTMSAELFLMQHTCHWYCKSKTVASARLLARHQTSYQQVVDAVSPETRSAYLALARG